MDTQALRLMVTAEVQKAISELEKLKGQAAGTETAVQKLGDVMGKAGVFAASVKFIKDATDSFIAQENALVKLNAVYKATGGAVGLSVNELEDFASELEATTGIADDAAMEMQSLLLTFKNIQGEGFKETSRLAVDLAAVMGGDVRGAAMQLGKALEDPINGLSALRRSGVSFTEAQQNTIKALVETNRLAEAQAIILKAVDGQVGGTAAALQNTLGGSLTAAANAFDNLLEVVGEGFAPAIRAVAQGVEAASKALQEVPAPVLAGAAAMATMTAGVNGLAGAAVALGIKLPAAFGPIGIAVAGVTAAIVLLTSAYAENEAAIKKLNEEQEKLLQLQREITGAFETATMTSGIDAQIQANLDLIATLKEQNRLLQESHNFNAATIEFNNTQIAQAEQLIVSLRQQKQEQEALAAAQAEAAREAARIAAEELARRERLLTQEKVMIRANRERAEALRTATAAAIAQAKAEETAAEMLAKARAIEEYNAALSDLAQAYADLDADNTDAADPFSQLAQGAQSALNVLGQWQPALTAFGNLYSEVSRQIQQENEAILKGMETAMQMDQLRYTNQIRNAQAAGQSTIALEQAAADAAYKAQADLDAKRAELEKKAFEREKLARMASIAMNTAVAVTQALATPGGIALAALVGGMGAAQFAIASQQQYPGLANGGTVTGAGMTMVGERGPELLNLPKGATVTPLGQGGVTVVIQGGTFIGSGGLDEAVIAIKKRMGQLERTGVLA